MSKEPPRTYTLLVTLTCTSADLALPKAAELAAAVEFGIQQRGVAHTALRNVKVSAVEGDRLYSPNQAAPEEKIRKAHRAIREA